MPTIIRFKKIRIAVHTNDHLPAHVHAIGIDGQEAKISLDDCEAFYVRKFSERDVKLIEAFVKENYKLLSDKWREYHG